MKTLLIILIYCLTLFNLFGQNIHRTACQGNLTRLDSMLTNSSIDITDNRGRSLLHWAVACQQKEVFDFLVQKGINIEAIDNQGKTAIHIAVQFGNEEFFDYLINLQSGNDWQSTYAGSLLELAVLNKDTFFLNKLIASGVNVNLPNKRGSTALEIAERIEDQNTYDFLISSGADKTLVRKFNLTGKYMGQEKPKTKPRLFAPNFISTEEEEFSCAFNAEGTEFYFGVDVGKRNEIRYSKIEDNQWTKPKAIITHEKYSYNDPFFSNDENRLYFISQRALDGKGEVKDVDIWYVERNEGGWSEPINAGVNINTSRDEYYISFTNEGTMYFSSNGHPRQDTSRTDHDIYYSKMINNVFQKAVPLDSSINTTSYEADVFVSPDESYIIFCSTRDGGLGRGDLYISFKNSNDTWSKAINMGQEINTSHYEYCPFVTKDGKYLFYTSNQDIYWVSTEVINKLRDELK